MKRLILAFLATIALTTTPAAAQYYYPQPAPSMTYESHCRVESHGYGAPPMMVCPPQGGYPGPQQWGPQQQWGPPQQWGPSPQYGGYMRPTGCADNYGRQVPMGFCDQQYGRGGYPPPQLYYGDRRGHVTFSFTYSR